MSPEIKIQTRYGERMPSGIRFSGVSRVKQEFQNEADINVLIRRFQKTGSFFQGRVSEAKPMFGDFTSVDYQSAQNALIRVENDFQALDSKTRALFRNDPAKLLEFLENPANHPRAAELGLLGSPSEAARNSSASPRVSGASSQSPAHDPLVSSVPTDTQRGPASGGESAEPSPKSGASN